jgi:hypothetical protein
LAGLAVPDRGSGVHLLGMTDSGRLLIWGLGPDGQPGPARPAPGAAATGVLQAVLNCDGRLACAYASGSLTVTDPATEEPARLDLNITITAITAVHGRYVLAVERSLVGLRTRIP